MGNRLTSWSKATGGQLEGKWSGLRSFVWLPLLGIAAMMRIPSLMGNLPDLYWHDEINFVEGALRVGSGEIRGASFGGYAHGTLTYVLFAIAIGVYFALGWLSGVFLNVEQFVVAYATDPSGVYVATRIVTFLASVGGVGMTWLIGRRLFGWRAALMAAAFMAVSFPSVHMTYGKEDGLFLFCMILGLYCATRILDQPGRLVPVLLAGSVLGASASVKYFGFLGITILAVACYGTIGNGLQRLVAFLAGSAAGGGTFFLCVPGVWLDTDRFIGSFLALGGGNAGTIFAETLGAADWYGYLWTTYATTCGLGFVFLSYCGAYWAFRERPLHGALLVVYPLALSLILMAVILVKGGAEAPYYQLSTVPFLALLAGYCVDKALSLPFRAVGWGVVGIAVLTLWGNTADSLRYHQLVQAEDSRTVAKKWIESHVPAGSSVLIEGSRRNFVLEGPQVRENERALVRDLAEIQHAGGSGRLWQAKLRALRSGAVTAPAYDLHKVFNLASSDLETVKPLYVVVRDDVGSRLVDAHNGYELVFDAPPTWRHMFPNIPMLSLADIRLLKSDAFASSGGRIVPGPPIRVYRAKAGGMGEFSKDRT